MEKLKIFARTIDDITLAQVNEMNECEAYHDSIIRIMPDCHAGKSCTVGTVVKVGDRVIPNTVGVDIGCGMLVAEFRDTTIDPQRIDETVNERIPSGFFIHERPIAKFDHLYEMKCVNMINSEKALCAIGTLGGGNHFIEVDKDNENVTYIVIHSGSRNLGVKVCGYYQQQAVKQLSDISLQSRAVIELLKAEGRTKDIVQELEKIEKPKVNKELAWLSGDALSDYLHDMKIVQEYARLNRETMLSTICMALGIAPSKTFHTIHNYIDMNGTDVILRKGAVSALKGEQLIIPMNMRDGSLICVGKGNADWLCSAPHGAGRLMSRHEAHQSLSLEQFQASMQGIYSTSVCEETIDESPMVYKSMQEIIECIEPTVEIKKIIRPIYNFKAK